MAPLKIPWVLWAHLPHDQDWSMSSYTSIMPSTTVEELWGVAHALPPALLCGCMVFFMRDGINPIWEDPLNKNGGYFSYKVVNKNAPEAWRVLMLRVAGETLTNSTPFNQAITGISISPKKGFCIIKVWMTSKQFSSPDPIACLHLKPSEGRFKAHV